MPSVQQIVLEEADESVYWLELVQRRRDTPAAAGLLLREAREIRAIMAKNRATTRGRQEEERESGRRQTRPTRSSG